MSLDLKDLCRPIQETPAELCVTLPGGLEVCAVPGELPPSLFSYARLALGAANSAMAPLGPIFTIIEVITAIQKCLSTIPGVLGPPPNPAKLVAALGDLSTLMQKLLQLVPQLSVPLMVVQLIDVVIATIDGAAAELTSLARFAQQIAEAEQTAGSAPALLEMVACSRSSLQLHLTNIERAFMATNPVLELVNTLGALAGLPTLPSFTSLTSDPTQAAQALQAAADSLRVIRAAIPI